MKRTIPTDGQIEFLNRLTQRYAACVSDDVEVPQKLSFKIASAEESPAIVRSARKAALKQIGARETIKKFAFDTRRYDQETTRNPRANLQSWIRSDQFIDDETQNKVEIFARLLQPLDELKTSYGAQPEWHDSYVRVLHDHVHRILRVKEADMDIFRPQIAYLEQLMFARYRLSMDELSRMKSDDFKQAILKKDEALMKRGAFLQMTNSTQPTVAVKDGNRSAQESIVNAIFGNNDLRRAGERTVERTITITIRDNVLE